MHILNKTLKPIVTVFLAAVLVGCESLNYYYQAVEGQLSILSKREPIEEVINDPETPPETQEKLKLVLDLRKFAEQELKLTVADSYSQYVDLKRPYVVWNVFAAPEFSVKPKTWCYPIAGCVAYKGFFAQADAHHHAQALQEDGYEVYVGGVAAYSTLGWFDDPVLNTFLFRSDIGLASLLFHELAHQKLYVKNDSAFNESFATAVEILGLESWLKQQGRAQDIEIAHSFRARKEAFVDLILRHREKLKTLYESSLTDNEKRQHKELLKQELLESYQRLKQSWGGYDGYDQWFNGPLNNAQLATIATYHHWVDSFKALFHEANGDWNRFYKLANEIAELKPSLREETLENLSKKGANYRL